MGRKGVRVEDDARWVFNRMAPVYHHRPPYPLALVARLIELAGAGARVLELGAGIGHLALPLARAGLEVTAVEPARHMLERLAASARAEGLPVVPVHAAAEATGLAAGGFEVALLADALHWIDPEPAGLELRRLLPPGGLVAVVEVELEDTPFLSALAELARGASPRAFPRRREAPGARREHLLELAGARGARQETWSDSRPLDDDSLAGLLASLSFIGPALGPSTQATLVARAREAAERAGEASWARRILLTHARRG